jgi:hypothetical protein
MFGGGARLGERGTAHTRHTSHKYELQASAASNCAREEVTRAPTRPEGIARLVLHPHWRCRVAWDGVSTVFLLYNIVIVPFRLCFDRCARCPNPVWLFEAMVDWFFVLDIFVNFLTGVVCHTARFTPD